MIGAAASSQDEGEPTDNQQEITEDEMEKTVKVWRARISSSATWMEKIELVVGSPEWQDVVSSICAQERRPRHEVAMELGEEPIPEPEVFLMGGLLDALHAQRRKSP